MESTVKHLKGYCCGEHEQLKLISTGERELKKNKDCLIFHSSDSPISVGTLRGFKDIRISNISTSNISSPSSLQSTSVKVKSGVLLIRIFFMSDPKSVKLLFVKHHHYKPLILYHIFSPVLHLLEKLRKYWSLLHQNLNANSDRIANPAARTQLSDQEVLKDHLSLQ